MTTKFIQLGFLCAALSSAQLASAQWNPQAVPTTTLTFGTNAKSAGPLVFGSTAGMQDPSSIFNGDPAGNNYGPTIILMGLEAFCVNRVVGKTVYGERGCQGTITSNHNAGDVVYYGPAQAFVQNQPGSAGQACNADQFAYTPVIVLPSAQVWTCAGGFWVLTSGGTYSTKAPHVVWYKHFFKWIKSWINNLTSFVQY